MEARRMLTMKEACRYLGVSRMTLLEAENRGMIAPERTIGGHRRYTRESLQALLQATQATHEERRFIAPAQGAFLLPQFISRLPTQAVAPDQVLKEALRNLVLLLRVEIGAIFVIGADGRLRLHTSFGIPHWVLKEMTVLSNQGVSAAALSTRQPQVYDGRVCGDLPAHLEIGQGLCVPLTYQGEDLGVVHVIASHPYQFFPSEISIVSTIAIYLASLLVNAQHDYTRVVMEQLPLGAVVVNAGFEVVLWNRAMERLSQVSQSEALGCNPGVVFPALEGGWRHLEQTLRQGAGHCIEEVLVGGVIVRCETQPIRPPGDDPARTRAVLYAHYRGESL